PTTSPRTTAQESSAPTRHPARAARAGSVALNQTRPAILIFEHDLARKPVPTFRDHALDVLAAVDVDFGAVHVRRRLRAQHIDDLGNLVRRAEPAHRNLLLD